MKPKLSKFALALVVGSTLSLCGNVRADIQLHPIFSDNMVLQREKPIPVWGTARAGERVQVQIGEQSKSAVADANGAWRIVFDALPATGSTPMTARGDNVIELKNVAVGEVWICSGQSNMAWPLSLAQNAQAEIANASHPDIRLFTVPPKIAAAPQKEFAAPAQWNVCTPQTATYFSAVGYFFGRELQQKLNVPIGLVSASWGGTVAEAWTSRQSLSDLGESYQKSIADFETLVAEREKTPLPQAVENWWQANDAGTRENWQALELPAADWKTIELPGEIERVEKDFDGVVWFRREIQIPENWSGQDLVLHLGNIEEQDDTFWNGTRVGGLTNPRVARTYAVPAALVEAGRAVVTVRVYDAYGPGGILGDAANRGRDLRLQWKSDAAQDLDLSGAWQYRLSAPRAATPAFPVDWAANFNLPSVLFNGMIAPLVPFGARGAIWYQGESNAGKPTEYRTLFPAMIRDWRTQWNAKADGSDFGFYFVQLANFLPRAPEPVQSGWAELREAQTMTLSTPGTGMALAIDVGDAADIHPRNKQDVGKRLALAALAKEYGQALEYSGPMFEKIEVAGKEARMQFFHAAGLKTSDGAAPLGFAISGADRKWCDANARIVENSVVVWSDEVPNPTAVRYAWKNNPQVNLVNAAGLPAVPFRTDGS